VLELVVCALASIVLPMRSIAAARLPAPAFASIMFVVVFIMRNDVKWFNTLTLDLEPKLAVKR
jgi:hypothetical protein